MCIAIDNPKLERPKGKLIAWKVFGSESGSIPRTFLNDGSFKTGLNVFDHKRARQYRNLDNVLVKSKGFQVFKNRSDAEGYAGRVDRVRKVIVYGKDVKAMDDSNFRIYHNVTGECNVVVEI